MNLAWTLHDPERAGWLTAVFRGFSKLGQPDVLFFLSFCVAAGLAWWRRVVHAVFVAGTLLAAWAIAVVVKEEVHRARPAFDDPIATSGGFAFPSGHASLATAFYGALLVVLWPLLPKGPFRVLLVAGTSILLFGIGLSRLYLGLHWLTDVLAGFCLGSGVLAVALLMEPLLARLIGWRSARAASR